MRITESQAQKNRQKVVARASRLFRESGFYGISVNDLMKAAGFTHGGFYNHFESKSALACEALDHAFRQMDGVREQMPGLDEFVASYLSEEARRAPGSTCPAAALAGEVARQPDSIKSVFAEGVERMILSIAESLPEAPSARQEAVDLVCRMVGALVLARAMPASSDLGRELLVTATERCQKDVTGSNRLRRGGRKSKL
ncbi:TetR/AcrR family transcriptional regulator [Bradyrhizobium diazoefficiens]|nr:TetR/AcrR family transcriptional regulator [Bradyrhizobium diazoefficiens]QQO23388.1 TetR/AcrR family transcriptional regulator [Bradyrhizobium diazoefficiens]